MPWIIALSVVLLLAALTRLFLTHAMVLRRDLDARFERIRVQLENDANAIVRDMLDDQRN
jgi:hypothetical protein